jgi:hypothetical protein
MPTIVEIEGAKVSIYGDDHNPPHFHIRFGGQECQVRISDLAVMQGKMPKAKLRAVLAWALENKLLLARHWTRINGE